MGWTEECRFGFFCRSASTFGEVALHSESVNKLQNTALPEITLSTEVLPEHDQRH
jgi:hypothetical protein